MKANIKIIIACVFLLLCINICGQVNASDGNAHGDPPFLLESGWIPLLNGKDMSGWIFLDETKADAWTATKGVFWNYPDNPRKLTAVSNTGDRIVNTVGTNGASNIMSSQKAGDMELYVEFMIPEVSNSGVYIHGLYELQIWDSFGKEPRFQTDKTGALYHYNGGPINGIDGQVLPLVRAERPHGQWNAYHIWFRAPRFDSSGRKTDNAKVLRALLNGELIHENQERLGPTTAAPNIPEAEENNVVMLQGDHGAVAFRNIYFKPVEGR
jgi:hypothetical protein